ncbi:MAG TPA: heme peroxidase family protein [Bryobacteraceae bacterium]|nr:heme peroxidase family protein [Bryobacteraceae bacterium]
MFRALHPAFDPDDDSLQNIFVQLGEAMSADFDPPKDGPDEEESGIPALYTYLGQFIDHDLTFDPASSLQQANDPDALTDFRTPAFDLDNVYGRGPDDQPYIYDGPNHPDSFLLGTPIQGAGDPKAADLPRGPNGRALIGDPRNDENSIVSQLQGLFLRFHNRFRAENPALNFANVQQQVRFHYQFVVLNDFLPRIVDENVLNALRTNGKYDRDRLKFYKPKKAPFLPVEFSVAAYRLGHSMVRPGYRLNNNVLLPIFPVPAQGFNEGLTGFRPLNPQWAIDWGRFIDIDQRAFGVELDDNGKLPGGGDPSAQQLADNQQRLQFAYRIDTSLVNPLHNLPAVVAVNPSVLATRNLLRAWRLGLPSGQAVADAMGVDALKDSQIVIGKATDDPDPDAKTIDQIANGAFVKKCPLWTYILAEAARTRTPVPIPVTGTQTISTPKLGPVGGRIVAEVFLGLMFGDPHSMLNVNPNWFPAMGANFKLKDFVAFALG